MEELIKSAPGLGAAVIIVFAFIKYLTTRDRAIESILRENIKISGRVIECLERIQR